MLTSKLQETDVNRHNEMDQDVVEVSTAFVPPMEDVRSVAGGLGDAAAITLIKTYVKCYPTTFFHKDKIDALSILTFLPPQAIEKIISQVLEDIRNDPSRHTKSSGMTKSSVTTAPSLQTTHHSLSSVTTVQSQSSGTAKLQGSDAGLGQLDSLNLGNQQILKQAADYLLNGRAEKCQPTSIMDLLSRDNEKIYQCTFKCGARFTRKAELKRHEEEMNYPKEGWVCDADIVVLVKGISTCAYCELQNPPMDHASVLHKNRLPSCHAKEPNVKGKIFTRKKRFIEHCKKFHPSLPVLDYVNKCHFVVRSKCPQWCGFCGQYQEFHNPRERNNHMARHFEDGRDMTLWREPPASSEIMDNGDGDTDDNGDKSDDDINGDANDDAGKDADDNANDNMDEDEDHPDSNHGVLRKTGGPLNRAGFQNKERRLEGSFSCLDQSAYRQDNLKQDALYAEVSGCLGSESLLENIRNNSALSFDDAQDSNPLLSDPVKVGNSSDWSNPSTLKPSLQSLQEPQMQVNGTGRSKLGDDLRNARVAYKSHNYVPINELRRVVSLDRAYAELQSYYPECTSETIVNNAELVAKNALRIFAILVDIGMGSSTLQFLEEGIKDIDLPIRLRSNHGKIRAFADWKPRAIENFERYQWRYLSPVFDSVGAHYEFDDVTIFPFMDAEGSTSLVKKGRNSEVTSVRIPPSHISTESLVRKCDLKNINWANYLQKPKPFALKRLFSSDREEFSREASVLRELTKRSHPHIVKLLATYRLQGQYYLLFPWASSNLRTYCQNNPEPKWDKESVLWSIRQMEGIASGLTTIHNFGTQATPNLSRHKLSSPAVQIQYNEDLFGCHGDIKPDNILWFEDTEDFGEGGILQIAGFGLERFHGRDSRSSVNSCPVTRTSTYEPPEIALSKPVSRAYDVWSLGCVYLEYISWILGGPLLLETFGNRRLTIENDCVLNDKFYTIQEDKTGKSQHILEENSGSLDRKSVSP